MLNKDTLDIITETGVEIMNAGLRRVGWSKYELLQKNYISPVTSDSGQIVNLVPTNIICV